MTEVPLEYAPSPAQEKVWMRYVMKELGTDVDGWWMGWCPLHDKARVENRSTAQFNFLRGVMRCEPAQLQQDSCHAPKRALSFQNVLTRMASDG